MPAYHPDTYTYFLFSKAHGAWKIGRTSWVEERAKLIRRMFGADDLRVIAIFPHEKVAEVDCHKLFENLWIGYEWFADHVAIRSFVRGSRLLQVQWWARQTPAEKKLYLVPRRNWPHQLSLLNHYRSCALESLR
jgi:hypothetical protein